MTTTYTASDLVLCESPDGWSLHAPGSTDEQIACGDAPYLVTGSGEPTAADYAHALAVLDRRPAATTTCIVDEATGAVVDA